MERPFTIPIPKTKKHINGKLRGPLDSTLIIFIHGLACDMEHHLFFNGVRWFEKNGYTTFRFNLYDWQPETRKLKECTIKTHAADIDTVVRYFRTKGVKRIHVIGHSYGGPSILSSRDQDFQSAVLWDPTALPTFKPYGAKRNGLDKSYVLPGA